MHRNFTVMFLLAITTVGCSYAPNRQAVYPNGPRPATPVKSGDLIDQDKPGVGSASRSKPKSISSRVDVPMLDQ